MSATPLSMKAILLDAFGGTDKLRMDYVDTPTPLPGEVQIRVAYAAVNPVDWKIREGILEKKLPHHFPIIPGWDASGEISALGDGVKKFKIGDEVFGYFRKPIVQWGTYAQYVCYEAEHVAFKPTNFSFAEAAAIPLAGLTAWQSLFDTAKLQKNEKVLIHAGAGGVGSLAIQFAHLAKAFILTTAQQDNHAYVRQLGADIAIDYRNHSVSGVVKHVAPEGLDVIFDTIGGKTLTDSFALLKRGGRLVSIVEIPNQTLAEQFGVQTFYVFVTPNGQELQKISDLIQSDQLKPIAIEKMPLAKAAEAQEKNQKHHVRGKIVLEISGSI